jgi:hypothetical protein
MARYLIVAHQTAASFELVDFARALSERDPDTSFVLLVPAKPAALPPTWEEGEVREIARRRAREAKIVLLGAGVNLVEARIGDPSPLQAVEDELCERPGYDGIVVSTFPPGISRWLHSDLPNRLRRHFGLPVEHVVATSVCARQTA